MHLIDPADHLRLMAQERERHLSRQRQLRVALARSEVVKNERGAQEAWLKLIRALGDVDDARRALVALDPR